MRAEFDSVVHVRLGRTLRPETVEEAQQIIVLVRDTLEGLSDSDWDWLRGSAGTPTDEALAVLSAATPEAPGEDIAHLMGGPSLRDADRAFIGGALSGDRRPEMLLLVAIEFQRTCADLKTLRKSYTGSSAAGFVRQVHELARGLQDRANQCKEESR